MLIDFLVNNLWAALLLWGALVFLNYILVNWTLRIYQRGVDKHFFYEVSPVLDPLKLQKPGASPRPVASILRFLLFGSLSFFSVWLGGKMERPPRPEFFEGILGAFLLVSLIVVVRHLRNLTLYHYVSRSLGISGKVEMTWWLSLKISAAEFLGWALFCGILFLFFGRWFFFGGAAACLISATKQLRLSQKAAATGMGKS